MSKTPRLTPAEWEIMTAVWRLDGPVSVRDVLESAYPNGEKAYTTVQTVMNRPIDQPSERMWCWLTSRMC